MNHDFFNGIVDETLTTTRHVLTTKGAEYSSRDDKCHNFKRAAGVLGVTPERALLGFKTKHTVSILDIIDNLDAGKLPSRELLTEKIGDEINYLILLKALIVERIALSELKEASTKNG